MSCCTSPRVSSRRPVIRRDGRRWSAWWPIRCRVVPVGRLDADTTGALLLTNDGALAHRLAHPRYGVEKVYEAEVLGVPDAAPTSSSCGRASSWRTAAPRRRAPACSHEGGSTRSWSSSSTRGAPTRSSGCSRPSGIRCAACTVPATPASTSAGLLRVSGASSPARKWRACAVVAQPGARRQGATKPSRS